MNFSIPKRRFAGDTQKPRLGIFRLREIACNTQSFDWYELAMPVPKARKPRYCRLIF